jgi:hypothetical protein
MNKKAAYRKTLRCTNKGQIRNLGRYLDRINYKWLSKRKVMEIKYHKRQISMGYHVTTGVNQKVGPSVLRNELQ